MFGLIAILILIFLALAVIFVAGTLFLQSNIYSEPTTGILWKSAASAGILAVFYAMWVFLDYKTLDPNRNDHPYDTLFRFSPTETRQVDRFVARIGNKEITYTLSRGGSLGSPQYIDESDPNKSPFSRTRTEGIVEEIIVKDDKGDMHFKPRLTKQGEFRSGEQFPGYDQVDGRYRMDQLGQLSIFRWNQYIFNLTINALHLGLWFVCLWLLLRYQWSHALFGAVIFWVIMTLVVVPMLLTKAQHTAQEKAGFQVRIILPETVRVVGG